MRKYLLALASIVFLYPLIVDAQNLGGNPAAIRWSQVNGRQARVIFPAGLDSQASRIHYLATALDSLDEYSLGKENRKWNILLLNQTTQSNAYVRLAPIMSELYMNPAQDNFALGSLRWDDNLIIHEDRHMHQFSNFNKGITKVFSFLFGQEGQLLANGITIPDYFFEGDAVWQETLVSKQGRGRMPSFYNGFKALWLADKKYSWMQTRNGSLRNYLPDHYQVGYPLVAYGYEKYGEDFWKKVTTDAVKFKGLFYSFNHAIERHSKITYKQFREDALVYFKEKTLASSTPKETLDYITPPQKNNVVDYLFPAYVNNDTILVTKQSYNEINSFYFLINGKEQKLRVKDVVRDDYFSYKNGKVVYAALKSNARRANKDYSDIRLLDIYSNKQRNITSGATYFSPDINEAGTEIIAVKIARDGSNFLHRLDAANGSIIRQLPNPQNYFFTQTKYLNDAEAVTAARHPDGRMALLKIDLQTGAAENLTSFSYSVLGYPSVKNDTVYYSMMDVPKPDSKAYSKAVSDKLFAVDVKSKKMYQLTDNANGFYQPVVNDKGEMLASAFTAMGQLLVKINEAEIMWKEKDSSDIAVVSNISNMKTNHQNFLAQPALDTLHARTQAYKKSFRLFNFHSARPYVSDVEYGYDFYGNNVVSTFSNNITYRYNRNEQSSSFGYNAIFAYLFPYLTTGMEYTYNRNIDTALGQGINFNSATANLGFYIPLRFVGGKTFKFLTFGGGYNVEQIPYIGIGKQVLDNVAFKYANAFLSFSNVSRQARQHINPRWAQAITLNYRKAFNFFETGKFVGNSAIYFPGLFRNHSLVLNAAFQKRDSLPDLFSNNFSYSRGYEALNTRRMYKLGVNYHFPLVYPDWGLGNIFFIQRIRANSFFDYSNSKARVNGQLTEIINRSAGGEVFFDSKIWNSLPVSFGIRYSHLLDTDLQNPMAKGRWEIILPINLIPN
ncbi:MAG: hypothetical protein H7X88_00700 [Gloeobacteraceae cyanobacterium ES-bin-316]|nr:hypothetical protein [Ferruginibacter sp.]